MPPTRREQLELDELLTEIYRGIEGLPDSKTNYQSAETSNRSQLSRNQSQNPNQRHNYQLEGERQPQRSTLKRSSNKQEQQSDPYSGSLLSRTLTPESRRRVRIVEHPPVEWSTKEIESPIADQNLEQHKNPKVKYVNTNKLIYHQEHDPEDYIQYLDQKENHQRKSKTLDRLSSSKYKTTIKHSDLEGHDDDSDGVTQVELYHTTWLDRQLGRANKRRSSKELRDRQIREKAMIEELKRNLKKGALTLKPNFKSKSKSKSPSPLGRLSPMTPTQQLRPNSPSLSPSPQPVSNRCNTLPASRPAPALNVPHQQQQQQQQYQQPQQHQQYNQPASQSYVYPSSRSSSQVTSHQTNSLIREKMRGGGHTPVHTRVQSPQPTTVGQNTSYYNNYPATRTTPQPQPQQQQQQQQQQQPKQQHPIYGNPHESLMQQRMSQQAAKTNAASLREFNELDSLLRSLSPGAPSRVQLTAGQHAQPAAPSFGVGAGPRACPADQYAQVQRAPATQPPAGGLQLQGRVSPRPSANQPQSMRRELHQQLLPFTIDATLERKPAEAKGQLPPGGQLSEFEPPVELIPSMEDYQNIAKLNPVKNHYWYKPDMSRDRAIELLRDKPQGTFIVRDSTSFRGAYGLAVKVAKLPKNIQRNPMADPSSELIRHFLIEPQEHGVKLKGYDNEPVFNSLPDLIYQHSLTELALPCRLLIPRADIEDQSFNQKQKDFYEDFIMSKEQAKRGPYDRTSPNNGYRIYPGGVKIHNEHRIIFE